jgi:protein phosphatase 2C family protein 2/3
MEDAHTHLLTLPEDKNCAFFAVYDGHGGLKKMDFRYNSIFVCLLGAKVAQHSHKHLHTRIANQPDFSSLLCRFFL